MRLKKGDFLMKLVIAIIGNDDTEVTVEELNNAGFYVTKLASTGGFFKKGNTSLMIGTDEDKVDAVAEIIGKTAGRRKEPQIAQPYVDPNVALMGAAATPLEVEVGGAVIFVIDVEKFMKK